MAGWRKFLSATKINQHIISKYKEKNIHENKHYQCQVHIILVLLYQEKYLMKFQGLMIGLLSIEYWQSSADIVVDVDMEHEVCQDCHLRNHKSYKDPTVPFFLWCFNGRLLSLSPRYRQWRQRKVFVSGFRDSNVKTARVFRFGFLFYVISVLNSFLWRSCVWLSSFAFFWFLLVCTIVFIFSFASVFDCSEWWEKWYLRLIRRNYKQLLKKLERENSPPLFTGCHQKHRIFTYHRLEEWEARFEKNYVVQDLS